MNVPFLLANRDEKQGFGRPFEIQIVPQAILLIYFTAIS